MTIYTRHLREPLLRALSDTPVVLVVGPRQAGKTTLVRDLLGEDHGARYLTLDDASVLAAAKNDPQAFVDGLAGDVILDEAQRAPGLFRAIKRAVDRDRRPGRFLLTGSANAMQLPRAAESLAGRMEPLSLWPLSQGELAGHRETFIDDVLAAGEWRPDRGDEPLDLEDRLLRGGYPDVRAREPDRRAAWFEAYLRTILQREVRDLAAIEGLDDLPRLLAILASRTATLTNFAAISREADIPQTSLKRYMALLRMTFLITRIPAWSTNLGKRLTKAPKTMLVDTGLACHLLGIGPERLDRDPGLSGRLLETFVTMELTRQLGWSHERGRLYHFRTTGGHEVDLVLEAPDGRIVAIEMKRGANPGPRAIRGLERLRDLVPDRFHRGVLLHGGDNVLTVSKRIVAAPIACVWS